MVSHPPGGGARAVARCIALREPPFSAEPGMLFRAYLTPAHGAALGRLAEWMREAGMTVRLDGAANLIGRYEGWRDMPPLVMGSHIDSVRDGGSYDGPLGIMLAIEAVEALAASGKRAPFPIEIYAFGDEEGSRFPASMLTSRAVAGTLDAAGLEMADREGVTLADALRQAGERWEIVTGRAPFGETAPFGDAAQYLAARHPGAIAYLEAHIEQGPVLEAAGLAVGVVTGIAAQLRYNIAVTGMAGHAGTTTMPLRRDALAAAAEMVLAAERIAREAASDVVATVGRLSALPGAPNVIPGRVDFTLDVRSLDHGRRDSAAAAILDAFAAIADRRGVALETGQTNDFAASPCDPALMDLLSASLAAAGQPAFRLPSGAGHDAMNMAALCPTAMLFLRCAGGISHNPAEHVDPADAEIALQVMLGFLDRLGETL
ncbi:allantoate amidohydrolase [Sphingomonas canadensis]|uniref:Allantoate amidohydrolase n=1 Tax=Sphingomonas canadensis TaxID=1219257 RepID=A0ABW3H8B6_9SPHN|nr:allantoate amidohydrolase [Sphingomonas canadensis]MCW3837399.1 allantoate amidohydrolase [Sphingomonas canadensis]